VTRARGGRSPVDVLVFGGFAGVALWERAGPSSVALFLLAVGCLVFARGPVSRVLAIFVFLVAWFGVPMAGIVLLGLVWLIRWVVDAGRRGDAPDEGAEAPPQVEVSQPGTNPTPGPEAELPRLQDEFGTSWPVHALDHAQADVRRRAVLALRDRGEVGALASRLPSEADDDVRLEIVAGLRAHARAESGDALGAIVSSPDHVWWFVQKNAVRALVEIGDRRAIPALVTALQKDDALLEDEALAALTRLGRDAIPELERGLTHPHRKVRAACARVLGRVGARPSASLVAPLLEAREPSVREAAAAALGEMDDLEHAGPLVAHLDEPSWEVRAACAEALGRLRFASAVPRLIARTSDPHDEVARAAVEALGRLGDPASIPALVEVLRGRWLRVEASEALISVGGTACSDALRPLLGAGDASLVLAVLDILGELGDTRVREDVRALASSDDPDLREAAARALSRLA
jgi:HEAT repeat protein